MISIFPQLNGFVICYMEKKEMETVYKRLKDLKLPEVAVKKSMHTVDAPYPWVIALICKDKKKTDELDDYLGDNKIELGKNKEIYVGEPRIQEFLFRMLPLDGKFEPGIARIAAGECPLNAKSAMACTFCMKGHMLSCHWPMTCGESKCDHYQREEGY